MEMIAIAAAGLVGAVGAVVCLVAWQRGAAVPPVVAIAAVAMPAVVGLLSAQTALSGVATPGGEAPALALVVPHVAITLVSRELAFFAALVPALCLSVGSFFVAVRAGEVRGRRSALIARTRCSSSLPSGGPSRSARCG